MKKTLLLAAAMLSLVAGSAMAAGLDLSWDDCLATTAGGLNKTSLCTSNSGSSNCYGTYVLANNTPSNVVANDMVMDINTNGSTLPCWWNFTAAPRTTGISVAFITPCASNATDYWGSVTGGPFGGFAAQLYPSVPQRVRIVMTVAIDGNAPEAAPVPGGQETYSYTFTLKNTNSVGTCTGCLTSACLVLNRINVDLSANPPIELTSQDARNFVFWQGGAINAPGCPLAVPTTNKTWGSVKALYR